MSRAVAIIAALCASVAVAQRSPFNGLEVLPADSNGHYRILIGGHFHGASTNRSGYPASTLLANLDTINKLGAHLFLSTGDLFMDPVKDRPHYRRSLFSKLKMPFFNAPGNHDGHSGSGIVHDIRMVGRVGYSDDQFVDVVSCCYRVHDRLHPVPPPGPEYVNLHLFLNLELSDGRLGIEDLRRLRGVVEGFELTVELNKRDRSPWSQTQRLFIVSHRPIWAEGDPRYTDLFKDNTRSLLGTNFQKDVYPLLEKIAEHAHVYWISGSLGGNAPSSIFFQEHAPNITYIQCAIRDEPRDALLIADVYPDSVKWSAFSLTGQQLFAPETYDAAWWRERVGRPKGFNWRLLPLLAKNTVAHRAFWWGAGVALLLSILLGRLFRRGH